MLLSPFEVLGALIFPSNIGITAGGWSLPLPPVDEDNGAWVLVGQRTIDVGHVPIDIRRDVLGSGPMNECGFPLREGVHVEGGSVGHLFAVLVEYYPSLGAGGVPNVDGVVVVDSTNAFRIPVLGDGEGSIRVAVGRRIVDVGAVPRSVTYHGSMNEHPFTRRGDIHVENAPLGHLLKILVEHRPPQIGVAIPNADGVVVVVAANASRIAETSWVATNLLRFRSPQESHTTLRYHGNHSTDTHRQ